MTYTLRPLRRLRLATWLLPAVFVFGSAMQVALAAPPPKSGQPAPAAPEFDPPGHWQAAWERADYFTDLGADAAKEALRKAQEVAKRNRENLKQWGKQVEGAERYTKLGPYIDGVNVLMAGANEGWEGMADASADAFFSGFPVGWGAELGVMAGTPFGPPGQILGGLVGGLAGSEVWTKLTKENRERAAAERQARGERAEALHREAQSDFQRAVEENERRRKDKEQEEARRKDEERKKQRKQDSDQSAFVKALKSCDFEGAKTLVDAQESGDFKSYLEGLYRSARTDLKIANGLIAEAHELNQSCRFDEALAKLEAAKQGPKCEKFSDILAKNVAAVKKDQKHEKAIKAMQNDANRLNQSCRFDEAMEKLEAAQNQTSCDGSRKKLGDMMAMVNQARQRMDQTRGLLGQAQGLYQQGDLNGSLAVLQRAGQQAECDEQHATIDNAIAAIQSRSKGQDVAGMVCADDRRQPVRAADGRIVCLCKDGLSEVQGFCLTPQEVAQVQPATNPDQWIEAISTIGTIIGIVGIITGASSGRPPSGGFSPSAPGQQKAQKCHPRPDGKGLHCSPG